MSSLAQPCPTCLSHPFVPRDTTGCPLCPFVSPVSWWDQGITQTAGTRPCWGTLLEGWRVHGPGVPCPVGPRIAVVDLEILKGGFVGTYTAHCRSSLAGPDPHGREGLVQLQ